MGKEVTMASLREFYDAVDTAELRGSLEVAIVVRMEADVRRLRQKKSTTPR